VRGSGELDLQDRLQAEELTPILAAVRLPSAAGRGDGVAESTGVRTPVSRRYWWVNHKLASRQEIDGGYLWSPKKPRRGANISHDNMTQAAPGDVVFSHAEGRIGAVGVVVDRVRTAVMLVEPDDKGNKGRSEAGWLLPVRFETLPRPLVPREHMEQLASVLPAKHAPIRASGERKQGVYLVEAPPTLAATLRELLGGQVQKIEEKIAIETDEQLTEAAIEERIWQRADLAPPQRLQQVKARLGQGAFRENVERIEQACRVTGVLDRRHLRVSHIKPWRVCDDRERLDGFNGLLLSPHIAHLFLRGNISFADDGRLLISRHLNPSVVKAWGLDNPRPLLPFRPEQREYLEFHRRNVFEKTSAGRRA
jgi:putative restriction endonuclease